MPGPCAVCNEPSVLICGGCKLLNYCGKNHQKIHWKQTHKQNCQPNFRIEENEVLGRHLIATRNIQKGEVIFQEPPLALGPKSVTLPICLGCHTFCDPKTYYECNGCGFPLCSPKCQVSDFHLDECKLMMKRKFRVKIDSEMNKKEISYFPIVPLRCFLLKDKNPEKFKKISNLQSHLQERINTPLYNNIYKKNVAEFLRERLGRKDLEENEILNVVGILDTNSFEIRTKKSKIRGLYNTASMLAHNCTPNTKHNFLEPEMTIVLTATTDITSGEIISATYTQTFWDTLSRRQHLKSTKCFDCGCKRCSDPTELGTYLGAIRCIRCVSQDNLVNGPYMLSLEPLKSNAPWKCQNCAHIISAKQIKSGNENLKEELSSGTKSAENLSEFLEKYGAYGTGVLHPKNYHVVQVKHALVKIYGNKDGYSYSDLSDAMLEKKIDYCHELLDIIDTLDPGFSQIRGEILNELQATMVIQVKRQYEQEKITKEAAEKILMDALAILKEVIEILQLELDVEEFQNRLMTLTKELGN